MEFPHFGISDNQKERNKMTKKRGESGLIQAGEIPIMKTLARNFAPPARAQLQLVDVAATIREQPDAAERASMARQLVLCTLPHSDPGNVPVWKRTSGNTSLGIQPGVDMDTEEINRLPLRHYPALASVLDDNRGSAHEEPGRHHHHRKANLAA